MAPTPMTLFETFLNPIPCKIWKVSAGILHVNHTVYVACNLGYHIKPKNFSRPQAVTCNVVETAQDRDVLGYYWSLIESDTWPFE